MSASTELYDAYYNETTKNNVEPVIIRGTTDCFKFEQENSLGKVASRELRFWNNSGAVYFLEDGRVVETSQTNSSFPCPLIAVFANRTEYFNYRKALPVNQYLWG